MGDREEPYLIRITNDKESNKKQPKKRNGFTVLTGAESKEDPILSDEEDDKEDMSSLYEEDDAKEELPADNVIRLKQHSGKVYVIIAIIVAALLLVGGYFYGNRTRTSYVVDSKVNRNDETAMEYFSFHGGYIKYNEDGITYEDKTGTIVWTEAFTMTDPKVVSCGDYVAVTDIGNNSYTLYNTSKKLGSFQTDYPITDIQVATQGLVAVVLEDEKTNFITAFDRMGTKCVEIKTTISKNGYPFAIALSEDGQKLVASYVTIDHTTVESSLTFYNFGDVGKNEVDRQVGYKKFSDQLFPSVEFLSNDTVSAIGDSRMVIYSMRQKPKELLNQKIKDEIKSVFYNSSYVGYICRSNKKSKTGETSEVSENTDHVTDDDARYVLKAYNLKGKQILKKDINFHYTNVHSNEREIIVLSDQHCEVVSYSGFERFQMDTEDLVDFFPSNRNNHYVMITRDATKMIHTK